MIVTEQEIDEEIVKETKDKAEDYRKLKYYQVALPILVILLFSCIDCFIIVIQKSFHKSLI